MAACGSSTTGSSSNARRGPTADSPSTSTYLGSEARTGFTGSTSITPSNAATLKQQWSVATGSPISVQPIVHGGTIYWGDWNGTEHATTLSGTSIWTTSLGTSPKPSSCPYKLQTLGVLSSATVGSSGGRNLVWVGGGAGQLVALNVSDGSTVWKTQLGPPPKHVLWSSPALYNGSIYEGVASWNDCPLVPGSLYRVNAGTGSIQAQFSVVSGKCNGGGIWSSPAVDPSDNAVFVTTGNDTCGSANQDAIIELDATTLAVKSRWTTPKSSFVSDADYGATPTLFSAKVNGVVRHMIGAEAKNGTYYAFDRNNLAAGPVWQVQVKDNAALANSNCADTLSPSAWAGDGSPLIVAGVAISGSGCTGTLSALDPATGRTDWRVTLQGAVLGAVTEAPGLVVVGAGSSLDVLSSSSGTMLYSFTEPETAADSGGGYGDAYYFWGTPAIVGNAIYMGNQDGTLRAFSP